MATLASPESIHALRDAWEDLPSAQLSPMLEPDWFESAVHAFHDQADLRVVVVRDSGRVVALAPLVIERGRGARLVIPGAATLYEPGGWVYTSVDTLGALVTEVMAMGYPVVLHRVMHPQDLLAATPGFVTAGALKRIRPVSPSLSLSIRGGWEAYAATLSARTFKKMASTRRRAEREVGLVSTSFADPRPDEVEHYLNLLTTIEGTGWKARQGSALALRPDLRRFFWHYARRAAERRRLRVTVLSLGALPAAIELAVEVSGRLWVLKIAYDEALSQYGPGVLLTHESIRHAHERALRSYEFLGVAEAWQQRWLPEARSCVAAALYPISRRGVMGAVSDVRSAIARRWLRRRALLPASGLEGEVR